MLDQQNETGSANAPVTPVEVALVLRARRLERLMKLGRSLFLVGMGLGGCGFLVRAANGTQTHFPCRAHQGEAKSNLKALFVSMESYREEYGSYFSGSSQGGYLGLGFAPKGSTIRYRYELTDVTADEFTGWAFGVHDDVRGDVWRINQENKIEPFRDVCHDRK